MTLEVDLLLSHTGTYMHKCAYIDENTKYIYMNTHAHKYPHTHTCMPACAPTHTNKHTHMHIHMHTHMHRVWTFAFLRLRGTL